MITYADEISIEEEIRTIYTGHRLTVNPYTYRFEDSFGNPHEIKAYLVVCKKQAQ